MNIKHIKDIKDTLIYKNSAVESQKKEYLTKDLFSSAREINTRIKKEEKRKRIKEISKDILDFIGLAFLFYITYNLLLLSAYLIN
tara:strand:+ start:277 stop:531 length:255 start_codon:yes stop_codon:yes gene_type:complete